MGCSSTFCNFPDSIIPENTLDQNLTVMKNNTSRSYINDLPTTDTTRHRPQLKRLNFQSLIFPQGQSDRSNNSYRTSEIKDKVASIINARNGKSFLMLLKHINFSVKIIQKLDKKKSDLDQSMTSIVSKESNLSISSFKTQQIIKSNDRFISEDCSNLLQFKNLFYLPLIAINGEIETHFEIIKHDQSSTTPFSFGSFGVLFDYYDSFFNFLINLFQNYDYKHYKEDLVQIASFAIDIQKMKLSYYPNSNQTTLRFYYMTEEFYTFLFGNEVYKEDDKSKVQKEFVGLNFGGNLTNSSYEIGYKNISLCASDCYMMISKYIKTSGLINQFQRFVKEYGKNTQYQKRVVTFSLIINVVSEGRMECVGFKIQQVATNENVTINTINTTTKNANTGTTTTGGESSIKINPKYASVKYQNISVTSDSHVLSYEYHPI